MNMNIKEYAKKILTDAGCDEYTYGGEYSKHVLDDLKKAFPNGMEFPYIDVANAILEISKPEPIYRAPWHVIWENEHSCDGVDAESFEEAKDIAIGILVDWVVDEIARYPIDLHEWTEEQIEDWDYFIGNCSVIVSKYHPMEDEYEYEYWMPSYEDEKEIGWMYYEELIKEA